MNAQTDKISLNSSGKSAWRICEAIKSSKIRSFQMTRMLYVVIEATLRLKKTIKNSKLLKLKWVLGNSDEAI